MLFCLWFYFSLTVLHGMGWVGTTSPFHRWGNWDPEMPCCLLHSCSQASPVFCIPVHWPSRIPKTPLTPTALRNSSVVLEVSPIYLFRRSANGNYFRYNPKTLFAFSTLTNIQWRFLTCAITTDEGRSKYEKPAVFY